MTASHAWASDVPTPVGRPRRALPDPEPPSHGGPDGTGPVWRIVGEQVQEVTASGETLNADDCDVDDLVDLVERHAGHHALVVRVADGGVRVYPPGHWPAVDVV